MSTRKGSGDTRTRKPAHQNNFAFRHNPKSKKTAKILASVNTGLCASCHDKVEWRKKYRKYKPLRQPATCNDCHQKTVTAAYHRICAPCAKQLRVCPFCCTKGRPRADHSADASDKCDENDLDHGREFEGVEREDKGEGKKAGGPQEEDSARGVDRQAREWEEELDDNIGSGGEKREPRGNSGRRGVEGVGRGNGGDVA